MNRSVALLVTAGASIVTAHLAHAQTQPGDVIINEIMKNPAAVTDALGEWLELFNTTSHPIDIDGWTIRDNESDFHVIDNGGPLVLPANGYLVLGANGDSSINGGVHVDYDYLGFFLGNAGDEVILIDNGVPNGLEIDRVVYDDGITFPDPVGASMALSAPDLDNDLGGNWCVSSVPYGDGDLGTPGAPNDCATVRVEQSGWSRTKILYR
jgi:hypothetical protein